MLILFKIAVNVTSKKLMVENNLKWQVLVE